MWAFSKDYKKEKKNSSNRHSLHNPILRCCDLAEKVVLRKRIVLFFSGPPIFIIKKDKKALARWPKVSPKNNKQKYKNWKVRKETKKWAPNIRAKTITVSTPSHTCARFKKKVRACVFVLLAEKAGPQDTQNRPKTKKKWNKQKTWKRINHFCWHCDNCTIETSSNEWWWNFCRALRQKNTKSECERACAK